MSSSAAAAAAAPQKKTNSKPKMVIHTSPFVTTRGPDGLLRGARHQSGEMGYVFAVIYGEKKDGEELVPAIKEGFLRAESVIVPFVARETPLKAEWSKAGVYGYIFSHEAVMERTFMEGCSGNDALIDPNMLWVPLKEFVAGETMVITSRDLEAYRAKLETVLDNVVKVINPVMFERLGADAEL